MVRILIHQVPDLNGETSSAFLPWASTKHHFLALVIALYSSRRFC